MRSIVIKHKGDFKNIEGFFKRGVQLKVRDVLERCAQAGVEALSAATPVRTGLTAASWGYEITLDPNNGQYGITWINTNLAKGWANVAIMLQMGHGTRNGGYVKGIDYINPALEPVFEQFLNEIWEEVTG